ncbi:MAG: DUF4282 domain-containing protein [Bacilli bacterium]
MDKFLKNFFCSEKITVGKYLKYIFWAWLVVFVIGKLDWLFDYAEYMGFFDVIWFIINFIFSLILIRVGYEAALIIFNKKSKK